MVVLPHNENFEFTVQIIFNIFNATNINIFYSVTYITFFNVTFLAYRKFYYRFKQHKTLIQN